MNCNSRIRQIHRSLSITFTVAVMVNIVVMGLGELAIWVGLLTLLPLALLLPTGLYWFVPPYAARWRGERRTDVTVVLE